ncbi:glycine cleavage system aminomethyltransferase GcvT [Paenibacillus alvei]|uniref:glycine cleavage system aminomethyltransferase GcvT n=1 Tax=Paenibacillus alvei TaxID=44250 RepID=UPI0002894301|nr:glycine cleavage system aminomethyltransferase GcvT [Paenibacillus alvei]EJW16220.1 aminomethyltransferase GcvT [Paenibacillus alvei DSM 29]MCY9544954.1 glycine cleavage system aminomethyltransferase GcvT [Paenibacillus alvei]MCY9704448.1 glycine cleavage system aminomethyltransferase GcvT [Paenibacillus alvei]MCY9732891.1 glycine cleavage system aminomethyltransferase GcvT [Paenibacillus alvei]MCY9754789.1 glycine cleavage system aminomethyltransferase GcvT [Paenibacillus alvei]
MSQLKRTPIFDQYSTFPGARCIDFGGWELPVQFIGIQREHEAVRTQAGLFDVSHMGEFIVSGPASLTFLQQMTTNDVSRLEDGKAQYTLMCYPDGGVVDDILIYRMKSDRYMLVVNASNIDKDYAWLQKHLIHGVTLTNVSNRTALIALQGPNAQAILSTVSEVPVDSLAPFHFLTDAQVCGVSTLLSRSGYTGEDGFELYLSAEDAPGVWAELLRAGESFGLLPAGLGARDTLRFEARLPLYGQEITADISPLEAGLGRFVKLDKGDFIGRVALTKQKADGPARKLVGIEMIDKGIPRSHYPVLANGRVIGEVTTGTQSPTLKRNLGLALIETAFSELDTEVMVEIRGKQLKARVVPTPFYKRNPIPAKGANPS